MLTRKSIVAARIGAARANQCAVFALSQMLQAVRRSTDACV